LTLSPHAGRVEPKASGGDQDLRIYLDHNATTPVRDEVAAAMLRVLRDVHGNPSSVHAEGAAARAELDGARERTAALLGVAPAEIVFTAGATEANNAALAAVLSRPDGRRHVVATAVEHPSVDAALAHLEARGCSVTRVGVGRSGRVAAVDVAAALRDDTALVTAIWANNETGVLQPIEEIAELAAERGAWMHSDATQAVGKHAIAPAQLPVDLLSLSAHKFGGPKGVGCLVVRSGIALPPFLRGGPQERGRRGGTENMAGIAGLGAACELARRELSERVARYAQLRDRLWDGIAAKVPDVSRNGDPKHVLANTLNLCFRDTPGELLLQALDLEGIAVSAGAACASGSVEPSHVLVAMGYSKAEARGTLRFSVGHGSDEAQIDRVLSVLPDLVARVRAAGDA
jgi:cysteine desulfurase